MQDLPTSLEIVDVVSEFLRKQVLPELEGRTKFHALVAANALDIVRRELENAPTANADEHTRLRTLLGTDGTLEELNDLLCRGLESGKINLKTPGLKEHLWTSTLTKLAIDQPKYSAYKKAMAEDRT
ncbi:MAG: hypothetical protein COA62_01585 [Rhodobiaceae bacterium]|nr:MAG: hypothetical protein COA62_01585 [Rhodobiaceae bacterium]